MEKYFSYFILFYFISCFVPLHFSSVKEKYGKSVLLLKDFLVECFALNFCPSMRCIAVPYQQK